MTKEIEDLILQCKNDCAAGRNQDKATIVRLLQVDPVSEDAMLIRAAANELTRKATGCRGWVNFSIGVDYVPCKGNCRFCSFGEKWGIVNDSNSYVLTHDEVVLTTKVHLAQGAMGIVLRTTEFYPHDDLVEMTRRVRAEVPGDYYIGINTGELSLQDCIDLYEAGANSATHMLRINEGEDTGIDVERRILTIENIKASPLKWGCCLDPLGPEHTPEQIADLLLKYHELGSRTCSIMKRSNVAGTPLGDTQGELTDEQCLLYAAALRICSGVSYSGDIHPFCEESLYSGGSGYCVETGAVPRTHDFVDGEWPDQQIPEAIAMMKKAGFTTVDTNDNDLREAFGLDRKPAGGCGCCA